jgi:predicted amidophosphoribosyltransferase
VAGAFSYEGPELDGLRIALVDDVVTTGATASECATVLKDFGAASVVAVSFTRMSYRPGLAAITD